MNRRLSRKSRLKEHLEDGLNSVEMILIRIHNLEFKRGNIEDKYLENSLELSYCDLEIALGLCSVIIRKASENSYVNITSKFRKNINILIHSNRFNFDKSSKKMIIYSKQSSGEVLIDDFIEEGYKILEELKSN